jgi:hypothetical protein
MKKQLLFIGVILSCLFFSCKKDSTPSPPPPPPPIDSFLLHPPPVHDSLSIPLTTGTWWKYQRIDSIFTPSFPPFPSKYIYDSSIEQITVIGKTSIVESATSYTPSLRTRYDTVQSIMLEVKNLTKGTVDTLHAFYYINYFFISPANPNFFDISIKVPLVEGISVGFQPISLMRDNIKVNTNTVYTAFNKTFDGCYYTEDFSSTCCSEYINHNVTTYLKPNVGFVYWSVEHSDFSHYGFGTINWGYRRLIDYHIEP